jgi:hypothetical protein
MKFHERHEHLSINIEYLKSDSNTKGISLQKFISKPEKELHNFYG